MENSYKSSGTDKAVKGMLKISAIVIMIMVWILIDKGNIYGQSVTDRAVMVKQSQQQTPTPLYRESDEGGGRDGGIKDEDTDTDFIVKPNPVDKDLVFDFEFTVKTEIPYEILDPLGKLVDRGVFEPGVSTQMIDLSHLRTGMYLIRLDIAGKMAVRRIIKR